jgi:hypothetical protein
MLTVKTRLQPALAAKLSQPSRCPAAQWAANLAPPGPRQGVRMPGQRLPLPASPYLHHVSHCVALSAPRRGADRHQ